MKYAIYDGHVHGFGSVRVDGEVYGSDDLKKVAEVLLDHPKTVGMIYGPIRVYSRGPNDLRLEYTFKAQAWDPDRLSEQLHGQVKNIVLSILKIKGRWNHSHWLGVELVTNN